MDKRGVLKIEVGGKPAKMLATHDAMFELFEVLKGGFLDATRMIIQNGLTPMQCAEVILLGLRANDDTRFSLNDIKQQMFKDGFKDWHVVVTQYVAMLLTGMDDQDGGDAQGK
jgi:hypothetical protein